MNAYKKTLGSHNIYKEGICAKKGEDVPIVKRREERGV